MTDKGACVAYGESSQTGMNAKNKIDGAVMRINCCIFAAIVSVDQVLERVQQDAVQLHSTWANALYTPDVCRPRASSPVDALRLAERLIAEQGLS